MTNFQIGVIAAFVIFAVVGVLAFAGVGGFGGKNKEIGAIEIWGTIPREIFDDLLSKVREEDDNFAKVKYVEKDKRTYEKEFIENLAAGVGPDLFLLDHDSIFSNRSRIIEIPYKSFSQRDFKDIFIEEGEIYLTETGTLGLPLTIDPLVMYWNRNIFQDASISVPPKFWDELFVLSPKITQRDVSSNIIRSFTALGEFNNIENAKEILASFIMQSGNPIVISQDGVTESIIDEKLGFATSPAEAAVRFYTEFSNPIKSVYSWNRSLPNSKDLFVAGDLAIYFGFASELASIIRSNPNLNFDVSTLPQLRDFKVRRTYGRMSAFAISRVSKNPSAAFAVAIVLTNISNISTLSSMLGLPPVRRDLLVVQPESAFGSIFYDSALISKAWLDPDSDETEDIFRNMIESVTSGREELGEAVEIADEELDLLLRSR